MHERLNGHEAERVPVLQLVPLVLVAPVINTHAHRLRSFLVLRIQLVHYLLDLVPLRLLDYALVFFQLHLLEAEDAVGTQVVEPVALRLVLLLEVEC